jgi:hypothetical protein
MELVEVLLGLLLYQPAPREKDLSLSILKTELRNAGSTMSYSVVCENRTGI